jgi:hypothetical protein
MKKIPALILIACFVAGCNSKSKSTKDLLVGEWRFEKSDPVPESVEIRSRRENMVVKFNDDMSYTTSDSGTVISSGKYRLSDDNHRLYSTREESAAEDSFDIIELTKDLLKVNMTPGEKEYLFFRRIK